jgi:hypothetical protein
MNRSPINPGRVEWSGENPGIYLKETKDGDYSVLALFFRVVFSPYGRGSAAIVLASPDAQQGWPEVTNFIMTDNQRMMRWIVDGWVRKMPTFRGRVGIDGMRWLDLDSVSKTPGNLKDKYSEVLRGSGVTLEMIWKDMGTPIPVEVTPENSATREHEMYSVFLEAKDAEIHVNGIKLQGHVQDRTIFGRSMSTAFLAFSETWVTPAGQEPQS